MDVPHLLPLCRTERIKPNRTRVASDVPIFDGYLFIGGDFVDLMNARRSRRIVHIIPVADVPTLISQLTTLLDAIDAGLPVGRARKFEPGARVRVVEGHPRLGGQEGTYIDDADGGGTLLVHVGVLGLAWPVKLDPWEVEAVA